MVRHPPGQRVRRLRQGRCAHEGTDPSLLANESIGLVLRQRRGTEVPVGREERVHEYVVDPGRQHRILGAVGPAPLRNAPHPPMRGSHDGDGLFGLGLRAVGRRGHVEGGPREATERVLLVAGMLFHAGDDLGV